MSKLANNWERAFQNRLPKALKEYTEAYVYLSPQYKKCR